MSAPVRNTPPPIFPNFGMIPPQAQDLEEGILGALLADPEAISEVADILRPEQFYNSAFGMVYGAILQMFGKGFPVDLLTVAEYLRKEGQLEQVGGPYALTEMQKRVCSAIHIQSHAHVVVQKWMARQLIVNSSTIQQLAFDDTTDVFELCEIAEKGIFEVTNVAAIGAPKHVSEIGVKLMKRNAAIQSGARTASGIPSGYDCLDACVNNFGNSDFIIVAARPAMGKTAFVAGSIIEQARMDVPVLFFSIEMSAEQILARMASYITEIPVDTILKAKYDEHDGQRIAEAIAEIDELPIYIDASSPSPVQIASKARRAKMQHKIGIVFIDYIQIIPYSERDRKRHDEITYISASLKRLAKYLDVPVVALSQLSRDVEKRQDKRPMLSDLRESGSLEQDADMVIFLYRDEYYNILQDSMGNSTVGRGEFIVAKHRNGATGIVEAGWKGHCAKYFSLSNHPF